MFYTEYNIQDTDGCCTLRGHCSLASVWSRCSVRLLTCVTLCSRQPAVTAVTPLLLPEELLLPASSKYLRQHPPSVPASSICASILHLCQHPPLAMLMLVLALSPVLVTAAPEAEPLLGGLYPGPGAVLGYCANQGVCVPPVHCSAHYYHLAQVQTCKPCWKMLSNFGENA